MNRDEGEIVFFGGIGLVRGYDFEGMVAVEGYNGGNEKF